METCIKELFGDVIIKAIEDWRDCIKDEIAKIAEGEDYQPKVEAGVSYDEIRRFFRSDYGAGLCELLNTDSVSILNRLESERAFKLQRATRVPA